MAEEKLPTESQDANLPQEYDEDFGNESYDADLEDQGTAVAAGTTNKIMGIIVLVIISIAILYFAFGGEEVDPNEQKEVKVYDEERKKEEAPVYTVAPEPEGEIEPVIEEITPEEDIVPDIIELEVPKLPELEVAEIPSEEDFGIVPDFGGEDIFAMEEEKTEEREEGKKKDGELSMPDDDLIEPSAPSVGGGSGGEESASMMLMSAGGEDILEGEASQIAISSFSSVQATRIEFPERTIAQGKLIDSVLETAINTDFEGKVRAIVSRDVFADFGRSILIPRGSRLIGSYTGSASRGQTRVLVTWERLIRPDAIDIQINSPATDQFGRSGVPGAVDNKYLQLFNNSILLSLITIGTAMAIEESTNTSGVTEEEETNGDTKTTSKPSDLAAQEIINTISDTAQTVLSGVLNTNPTITVPHGTRIKVFVNQDLIFPENVLSSGNNDNVLFIN